MREEIPLPGLEVAVQLGCPVQPANNGIHVPLGRIIRLLQALYEAVLSSATFLQLLHLLQHQHLALTMRLQG